MKKLIRLAIVMIGALLFMPQVQARLIRTFYLDDDINKCERVFVGTVNNVQVAGVEQSGSEVLDVLSVSTTVKLSIKGELKEGDNVAFRHRRPNASSPPVVNGHLAFDFEPTHTYLFLLQKTVDGQFELPAPEDYAQIVELSPVLLSIIQRPPKESAPLDYVVSMLVQFVEEEPSHCAAAVWLLESSRAFEQRLQDRAIRTRFIATLIQSTKTTEDENTLSAIYALLGKLNETSVIPDIIHFSTQEQQTKIIKSNAINWLFGFSPEEQRKALKVIVEQAHDKDVVEYAKRRLDSNLGVIQGSHRVETEASPPPQ